MGCGPSDLYYNKNGKAIRNSRGVALDPSLAASQAATPEQIQREEEQRIIKKQLEDPTYVPWKGGGKEPSAAELKVMLILLENVEIKDGKVNQAAESDIMERVESPFNRQNMIDIAKNNSSKAATAIKILRILFEIDSVKKRFTAAEKREVKTIFQREGGVTRRLKRR